MSLFPEVPFIFHSSLHPMCQGLPFPCLPPGHALEEGIVPRGEGVSVPRNYPLINHETIITTTIVSEVVVCGSGFLLALVPDTSRGLQDAETDVK